MIIVDTALQQRVREGRPIQVGLVGAGLSAAYGARVLAVVLDALPAAERADLFLFKPLWQRAIVVARLVRMVEPVAGLNNNRRDNSKIDKRSALSQRRHHARQRHPVQVLHGDEPGRIVVPERKHATHVGMH